ncbi:uncharacterized protein zgc:113229 [Toxotes jaculatrix]|uniref:uncharacterized protein zgc:113229 n=1 Tax=Toxotes jaculatrix TaxID=941984 RepID=UPI001B3A80DF|nr:uncharacterized protein zgc:113229 [Toxotes jaculatrix]
MSQSHNPTDTQSLLQSMLQRLKLQSGREGQPFLHSPVPAANTWKQDGEREAANLQRVNNSPANGFEFGTNGSPSKKFGISAADSNFGLKGREIQQPGLDSGINRGLISFPSQKDDIDNNTGENRVLEQAPSPRITPTGTGQLFPAKALKDADLTSFERTDGERVSFGSSAMTRHIPGNEDTVPSPGQNQGFTPKVYTWSLKSTDANLDTGSQDNKVLPMENGGFGDLAQSKDMQFFATSQNTTSSGSRRKQRPSENKTRRWTQKLKERWLERSGSFGKKGKEVGGRVDRESEQGTGISTQNQLLTAEGLINTSVKEEDKPDSSEPSETPPTRTEDSTLEGRIRSSSDFDFGLGSFSLLDEIVTGQEWAKFLNPNLPPTSTNQRPPEQPLGKPQIPPNPSDSGQLSLILNQQGSGNSPWSFRGTESSPGLDFSMAQISPDAFLPVGMDVSGGKQQQDVHRVADQSEPMEDWQSGERGQRQQCRPSPSAQPADVVDNSALKRVSLNRKRQHQSAERRDEGLQPEKISDGNETGRGGSISSLSITSSHAMDETGESQSDVAMLLHTVNSSSSPLSPSSFNPFAPAPRGVLRHSISQDSESSMETVTKRRRVEENRRVHRVHFAEEMVTIVPPKLDMDVTDSEEDSEADDDSVIEQAYEVEQAAMEEVAPARRHALPAWIQALKRKNTGRKHR